MENRPDNLDATTPNPNPIPTSEPVPTDTSAQSGIFSSSDTRIETENLPAIQPTPMSTAPAGAITPAVRTESTVTGDLKLGNGKPKGKKWLMVAGVVLAVVLIGAGMWYFLGNSNLSTREERTTYGVTDESRALFNRYVNFLVNDTDSTNKPELADFLASDYTLMRPEAMFAEQIKLDGDMESARTYFNDLSSIYSEFSRAFFPPESDTEETTESYFRNAISDYFFEAAKGSYLNLDQVISLYLQEGEESTRNMLANILKPDCECVRNPKF